MSTTLTMDSRNQELADKLSLLLTFNYSVGFAYSFGGIQVASEDQISAVTEEINNIVASIDNDQIETIAMYVAKKSIDMFITESNLYANLEKHGFNPEPVMEELENRKPMLELTTINEIKELHNKLK